MDWYVINKRDEEPSRSSNAIGPYDMQTAGVAADQMNGHIAREGYLPTYIAVPENSVVLEYLAAEMNSILNTAM